MDWRFADATYEDPVRVAMHSWICVPATAGRAAGRCEARVSETLNKRRSVAKHVPAAAASAMLVEALVLAVMGWLAIARSLKPMERLSKDIEQRSPEHLGAVDRPDIPREVAPLVTALNGLFARVVTASAAEKAFIADAAHQLRTPLTALRTETELALLETHPPQIDALLRRLHMATTRAARLANQLLSQARAEHVRHNSAMERFDLKQIATEAAEEWVARSVDAGVDLGFELESARVDGHGFLLREMLANLLDNAINYAGPGARVTDPHRRVGRRAGARDAGGGGQRPRHPAADRERAFERFQRGNAGGTGSGLGLSIVRDIAGHHGARAELLDGPGGVGLRVRVTFAPAWTPAARRRRVTRPRRASTSAGTEPAGARATIAPCSSRPSTTSAVSSARPTRSPPAARRCRRSRSSRRSGSRSTPSTTPTWPTSTPRWPRCSRWTTAAPTRSCTWRCTSRSASSAASTSPAASARRWNCWPRAGSRCTTPTTRRWTASAR